MIEVMNLKKTLFLVCIMAFFTSDINAGVDGYVFNPPGPEITTAGVPVSINFQKTLDGGDDDFYNGTASITSIHPTR
jgi:hypothetical protein